MKKTLCLVIPSLQPGGMERVMSELAGYFCSKNELEIHMVLYGKTPELFYHVPDSLIIHEPVTQFSDKFRTFSTLKRLIYLRKKIRSIKPATVLSFGEYWNSFVLIALIGLQVRVFVSDRCNPDYDLGKFHGLLRKLLYPRSAGVIIQTVAALEIYQKILPRTNLRVIGNPIRSIPCDPQTIKENIVLSVGMLINSKHFDSLIRVFAEINKPDWKLIIVGDDALRQQNKIKLEALVKELDIESRIILTGLSSDVESFYRKSKIFAFTSSSEGFPNVIGEAMSSGLPVVAFDCLAGPSEMIDDSKNGFLVSLFDYKLLKEKLEILMNNQKLSEMMGFAAERSIKRFSVEIIGEEYYSFITSGK